MTTPGTVTVRGGAFSIAADMDALDVLAHRFGRLGAAFGHSARVLTSALLGTAQASGAILDPVGALHVAEAWALAEALLATCAAGAEAIGVDMRLAASAYRAADRGLEILAPEARAVCELQTAVVAALPALGTATALRSPSRALSAVEAVVERDPDLAGALVAGVSAAAVPMAVAVSAPLLSSARSPVPVLPAAAMVGRLYPDGDPVTVRQPRAIGADRAGPPRGVADLLHGLTVRNDTDVDGAIDVRFVQGAGGPHAPRHVIVDLTGTNDWNATTLRNGHVADLGTNFRAMAGEQTTYERGVLLALRQAGVRSDEPVMLVGHSQGGMVAARLAADLAQSPTPEFRVTHLVTAGSPLGLMTLPSGVEALCIENRGDAVPLLDTADNEVSARHLTVGVDRGGRTLEQRHDLADAYSVGGRDIDASADPSLAAWRRTARGFFDGRTVTTLTYQIRRRF